MTMSLTPFVDAGVITSTDLEMARVLSDLAGEGDASVLLAVALSFRTLRDGHVCLELKEAGDTLIAAHIPEPPVLQWPDFDTWSTQIIASPLTATRPEGASQFPLVYENQRLYLSRYHDHEATLAAAILQRVGYLRDDVDDTRLSESLTRLLGPDPDTHQRLACLAATWQDLAIISGGPGTGKTWTVVRILAILFEQADGHDERSIPLRVALAAPTGKAAARMVEAIGESLDGPSSLNVSDGIRQQLISVKAMTLHKLLGIRPDRPTKPRHHAQRPVPFDVVVVDESSMVDLPMMSRLMSALDPSTRLILLGDRYQLPSVGIGTVFASLYPPPERSGLSQAFADRAQALQGIPHNSDEPIRQAPGLGDAMAELQTVHRSNTDIVSVTGLIPDIARGLRPAGELLEAIDRQEAISLQSPGAAGPTSDQRQSIADHLQPYARAVALHVQNTRTSDDLTDESIRAVLTTLNHFRVLCANRRGPLGVETLNAIITQTLSATHPVFQSNVPFYVGRPIMVTQNDPNLGLSNGDMGVIVTHPETHSRCAAFMRTDGSLQFVSTGRLPAHDTAFATTIHKSQGSEFRHVAIFLPETPESPLASRELVYTAMTRAKETVLLVAHEEVLRAACARGTTRWSGLSERLWPPT